MGKRYYIGFGTTFHDPAITILNDDGDVLFAEAAERRYQVKKALGCPPDNFMWAEDIIRKYCTPGADFIITKSWSNRFSNKVKLANLAGFTRFDFNHRLIKKVLNFKEIPLESFYNAVWLFNSHQTMQMNAGLCVEKAIRTLMSPGIIERRSYDHHLSHASYACYASPFSHAVCLVVDAGGEDRSYSIYKYEKGKILQPEKQKGNASLGYFYNKLTILCDFDPTKGEEWKVMGLAAYGSFNEHLYELFRSIYYVEGCDIKCRKSLFSIFKIMKEIQMLTFGSPTDNSLKANIAYNGQLAYSEWMNELITNIHNKYSSDNLILVGGCALNSSHNGEILDKTPFKNLYVPSAPADDGCALGGALLAYYADHPHTGSIHKNLSPYLGTEITDEHVQHFLQFSGQKVRKLSADKYDVVASLLAAGKIVGWVQGKAEYGPRALGNRSILADPRRKEIKDIINERVKFREEFRPFAPSILHEYGHEYFEHYQESHYMERTLTFKKEAIEKVPGVVHVNNTGRLQTVKEDWNAGLYHLIKAFHDITGVPVLLNTSFNIMGKPIIHTIEDAISTFFTTGMDALVINDYLIEK